MYMYGDGVRKCPDWMDVAVVMSGPGAISALEQKRTPSSWLSNTQDSWDYDDITR